MKKKYVVTLCLTLAVLLVVSAVLVGVHQSTKDKLFVPLTHYYDLPDYSVGELIPLYYITDADTFVERVTFPEWPEAEVRMEGDISSDYGKYQLRTLSLSLYTKPEGVKSIHQLQLSFSDGEQRLVHIGELILSAQQSDVSRSSSRKEGYGVFSTYLPQEDVVFKTGSSRLSVGDELEVEVLTESGEALQGVTVPGGTPTVLRGRLSVPEKYKMCVFNFQQMLHFQTASGAEKIGRLPAFEILPELTEETIEAWYVE